MFDQSQTSTPRDADRSAKEWARVLLQYRDPNLGRSTLELAITIGPFVALWALAWWSMSVSYWLTLAISLVNAGFLLRLFAIQHDCGHGAFLQSRTANDWVGRALGVLTLTPYLVWKRSHAIHHSAAGNLGRRGIGDIHTKTVEEYRALGGFDQFLYRLYRHPVFLFCVVPTYLYLLQNRLPLGFMGHTKSWVSAMGTNAALFALLAFVLYFGGLAPILLIFLPSTLLAATAGVWLFYVQHQFETTHWEDDADWQLHDSALKGSSHYVLPPVLQWMSANIGIHHVHHLYSRIPFYRLPEVLRDHAELDGCNRMTIMESLQSLRLRLWDEDARRLVSFAQAKAA